jgi:hypothetical protein
MPAASPAAPVPDPFTLDHYRALLEATRQRYEPRGFEMLGDPELERKRFCIIRHDIDVSPERALAVARIEAELGVRSTFMVQLTSTFYSPFEAASRDTLIEIAGLGHDIGLHFDASWHGIDAEDQLEAALASETQTLARLLGDIEIANFSFHNTTPFTMSCRKASYAGLWNAYAAILQEQVSYVSDTNGQWRFRTWSQALDEAPPRLQVLTHPEWWTHRELPPAEKLCGLLEERARRGWRDYAGALKAGNRENRSLVPEALDSLQWRGGAVGPDLLRQWLAGDREGALLGLCRQIALRPAALDGEAAAARARILATGQRLLAGEMVGPEELRATLTTASTLLAEACARDHSSRGFRE